MIAHEIARIEPQLYERCRAEIARFAPRHQDRTFVAFGLECDTMNGSILLCANTVETHVMHSLADAKWLLEGDFEAVAREHSRAERHLRDAVFQRLRAKFDRTSNEPIAQSNTDKALHWGRHWEFQGFNMLPSAGSQDVDPFWPQLRTRMLTLLDGEEDGFTSQFMEMACRVTFRLDAAGDLDGFVRAPGFQLSCRNHDEWAWDEFARFESVRRQILRAAFSTPT